MKTNAKFVEACLRALRRLGRSARAFWPSAAVVCLFLLQADPALAQRKSLCGPNMGGPSKPIPGDPDKLKGWLQTTQRDDTGAKMELWCVEIAQGVGNSFGYRYVPADGRNPVWWGLCAFVGGQNTHGKGPKEDKNRNGRHDRFTKAKHTTTDDSGGGQNDPRDDDDKPGKKDYDWEFDVATMTLKRWETNNGKRLRPNAPDSSGPAPERFSNLLAAVPPFNPDQPAADMHEEALVTLALVDHVGASWNYEVSGNALIEFSPTLVMQGDELSMAVAGVTDANAPAGWSVDFTSTYVTWTYLSSEPLNLSLASLTGFGLVSSAHAGQAFWLSGNPADDFAKLNFGYDGTAIGPVPEPGTYMLLATGLLGLIFARGRLRRPAS